MMLWRAVKSSSDRRSKQRKVQALIMSALLNSIKQQIRPQQRMTGSESVDVDRMDEGCDE